MSKLSVALHRPAVNDAPGLFTRLFAKRAAKPGEHFGAPGQGSSATIATSTVVAILLLWVVVSNSGLVKPIFLPTPQAVFAKFIQVATEGADKGARRLPAFGVVYLEPPCALAIILRDRYVPAAVEVLVRCAQ